MVNYRAFKVDVVSGSVGLGPKSAYDRAWGVMKDHSTSTATITLAGGGTLAGSHMIAGEIYPCYPAAILVSSGSFMLLS